MIIKRITKEFILTWDAASEVNQWLHENRPFPIHHPVEFDETTQLHWMMTKAIKKCIKQHNIQLQGDYCPTRSFTTESICKTVEWIDAQGKEVNRYCNFIDRVCAIRDEICVGIDL